jgi:GNAT superfamily N-acetyltransferase
MRLALHPLKSPNAWPARPVLPHDAPALAQLMLDAYRGTIDDEGETGEEALAEFNAMLDGKYGPWLADASFLVELDGRLVAASVITLWRDVPMVAQLFTHPDYANRGLGKFLLTRSINALHHQGYAELVLYVTEGNDSAQHLYTAIGFAATC